MADHAGLCVGLFNDSFPPILDGVATAVYNYASWLRRDDVRPVVVTPKVPGHDYHEDFEVLPYFSTPLPLKPPYRLGLTWFDQGIATTLPNIPLELIHAHSPFSAGRLALKVGKERHIPVIGTFHTKYYEDFLQTTGSKTFAVAMVSRIMDFFARCDFVWTVNTATVDTLRDYGFTKPVEVVENGTDLPAAGDPGAAREAVNRRYLIGEGENVLLFVGQHVWQKNVRLIINALSELRSRHFPFRMIFVGKGDAEEDMKRMARDLGIGDHVIFSGQVTDRSFLHALYARANLFVFPSAYDTAGLVVMEAAASGTPSVLLRGSDAAGPVRDGFNGFLAENSQESLATVITRAFSDRADLARVGENARKTMSRPWSEILVGVKERYRDIVASWR